MMNMTIPIIRQRILVGPALVAESLADFDSAAIVIESVNGFRLRASRDNLPHARKWVSEGVTSAHQARTQMKSPQRR
jgi:hypothetical protein